jgi:Sec-independent protein translocase protein TatA
MIDLGISKLALIGVVALIVIGPENYRKLPAWRALCLGVPSVTSVT